MKTGKGAKKGEWGVKGGGAERERERERENAANVCNRCEGTDRGAV